MRRGVTSRHKGPVTSLSVEQVDPLARVWLRQRVLRPHESYDEVAAATDVPDIFAIGALLERSLVSCVVAHPEAFPGEALPAEASAWRLRGMVTDPARRGQGYGAAVRDRTLDDPDIGPHVRMWRALEAKEGSRVG